MGYKNFASMSIAIIGEGSVAETVAGSLALCGYDIYIGTKKEYALLSTDLLENYENVFLTSIDDAAAVADIIILATPANDIREAAYLLDDVRQKVIIDMSAFHFTRFGAYINTLNAVRAITFSPLVVKCYCDGGYDRLANIFNKDKTGKMYFVGDNKKAKEIMKIVACDLGFRIFEDLGDSNDVVLLDGMSIGEGLTQDSRLEPVYVSK